MPLRSLIISAAVLCLACGRPPDPGPPPKDEYPRPDFARSEWLNLNGVWEFQFDPDDKGVEDSWFDGEDLDDEIHVPYPWESELSGVQQEGQSIGWYRRRFTPPADWSGQRIRLRFGAVDWAARVWIDGAEVGSHEGGYSPFELDITDQVEPGEEAEVVVRAFDPPDRDLPRGKQVERWYTYSSGIWQTVWLEARPAVHLADMALTPTRDAGGWSLEARLDIAGPDGPAHVELASDEPGVTPYAGDVTVAAGSAELTARLAIERGKPWSPAAPFLYPLTIRVTGADGATDEVASYFGLRTIERAKLPGDDYESILLNGKPVYLAGALDQSFNPKGLYTAPDDDFMKRDMELAKQLGFNFLRIHIKADEPRRLYWADRLGILLMEDAPSAEDLSSRGQQAWEATMRSMIDRDRNHPAIIAWCLFNESWGLGVGEDYKQQFKQTPATQQWVYRMWEAAKALDPTRLIDDNSVISGAHVRTDLNSWHFYMEDPARAREHVAEVVKNTQAGSEFNYMPGFRQDSAPLINAEYGAVGARQGDRDISWGFRDLTTLLRGYEKIQGYVYTELYDVEFERNGMLNYDRSPKELGYDAFVPDMTVADLQGADFVGYDGPPLINAKPGDKVAIRPFVSHFSDRSEAPLLQARLTGVNDLGGTIEFYSRPREADWKQYKVVRQPPIVMEVPNIRNYVGAVGLELVNSAGLRLAANFVNIVVRDEAQSPRQERIGGRRWILRAAPDDPADSSWTKEAIPGKLWGFGKGYVEYELTAPAGLAGVGVESIEVLAELASKADTERLAWPETRNDLDYPQTDEHKFPAKVKISLNGKELGQVELPDDPADSRGVLSHAAGVHRGSYGYLVKLELKPDDALVQALDQSGKLRLRIESLEGGLSVYGEKMGRYPIDPTVTIVTRDSLPE